VSAYPTMFNNGIWAIKVVGIIENIPRNRAIGKVTTIVVISRRLEI